MIKSDLQFHSKWLQSKEFFVMTETIETTVRIVNIGTPEIIAVIILIF